jgi:hypothetical protein
MRVDTTTGFLSAVLVLLAPVRASSARDLNERATVYHARQCRFESLAAHCRERAHVRCLAPAPNSPASPRNRWETVAIAVAPISCTRRWRSAQKRHLGPAKTLSTYPPRQTRI